MSTLILLEHNQNKLSQSNYSVASAALKLDKSFDALLIGVKCKNLAEQAAKMGGCNRVILVDHDVYRNLLPENCAKLVKEIAGSYEYLLAAHTTFGKNILPRVAALLDVTQISDVIKILSNDRFVRPTYAGNIIETVESSEPIKVLTVRATAFEEVPVQNPCSIEIKNIIFNNHQSKWLQHDIKQTTRPRLENAKVIVSGGRALKSSENFKLIEHLADKLGAAVGATRAAVDAGYISNEFQIGQTGKTVSPDLYFAVGISGATQHLAGMKDSKVVVAINKDENAPIFQIADYAVIGDLFEILPKIIKILEQR